MDLIIIFGVIILIIYLAFFRKRKKQIGNGEIDKGDKLSFKLAEAPISIIGGQIDILGGKDKLPPKSKDNYSIGFITGMIDSSIGKNGENDFEQLMEVLAVALKYLFGSSEGKKLTLKVFDLFEKEDAEFYRGMSDGGNEFLDFVRGQKQAPMGWYGYVIGSGY